MTGSNRIAASDAHNKKGGGAEAHTARIQDYAMLKVAERPTEGKAKTAPAQKFHTVSDTRRAALWLDEQVAAAGDNVTTVVADLTPDIAAVLLARNPANRKIKQYKLRDYTHDMQAGAWKFNGEPIIVARDGLLNDGQHRCAAVVEAKTPIKSVFVFGVERDSRDTLDQGINRSASDYLAIHGHSNTKHVASIAKAVWQWRTYGMLSTKHNLPTRSEVLKTALENPGIDASYQFCYRPNAKSFGSIAAIAFTHFAIKAVSGKAGADYFMDALIDGANLKPGDPILVVRNRLIIDRASLSLSDKVELLFRAWNAHRLGHARALFRVTGGELPLLEA